MTIDDDRIGYVRDEFHSWVSSNEKLKDIPFPLLAHILHSVIITDLNEWYKMDHELSGDVFITLIEEGTRVEDALMGVLLLEKDNPDRFKQISGIVGREDFRKAENEFHFMIGTIKRRLTGLMNEVGNESIVRELDDLCRIIKYDIDKSRAYVDSLDTSALRGAYYENVEADECKRGRK